MINKAPNPKLQILNNIKTQNSNTQNNCLEFWSFEYCNLFGACYFGFV